MLALWVPTPPAVRHGTASSVLLILQHLSSAQVSSSLGIGIAV